jgi:hypothetical protein
MQHIALERTVANSVPSIHGLWLGGEEIATTLPISRTTLYRLRKEGLLKPGVHFIRTTPGRTSRILWCPVALREAMASWSND